MQEKLPDKIKKMKKSIEKEKDILKKLDEGFTTFCSLLDSLKSEYYKEMIMRRWKELQAGYITYRINNYYQFWTDLHIRDDIVFFNVTSRIPPTFWDRPEMQLYEKRQIDSIKNYHEFISSKIKKHRKKNNNNFERIFVFDEKQLKENMDIITTVIKRQLEGGIKIRVIKIKINEISTIDRPQDFGIVETDKGDKFAMYVDTNEEGYHSGGLVVFDDDKIEKLELRYKQMQNNSQVISYEYSKERIKECLEKLESKDISDEHIYGNRCKDCLLEAEKRVGKNSWQEEESALRTWYHIINDENNAIKNAVQELNPQSILEIGCGPGRIIEIVKNLLENIVRIVGYEQNSEIQNYAEDRFKGAQIFARHVGGYNGKFGYLRPEDHENFDLVLALSNLVGWQDDEVKWIKEVIKAVKKNGYFLFTVYQRGVELERARMYRAAGDIIEIEDNNIYIFTDLFQDKKHISKSYTEAEIKMMLNKIKECINIDYKYIKIGHYMHGYLIQKLK